MPSRQSPTIRRRRLGLTLRRLRDAAGVTIEQVATVLECSDSKVSRIETGQVGVSPRDVRDMLEFYGVSGDQLDLLVQLARDAREKNWWDQEHGKVRFATLVGFQDASSSMRTYQQYLIPGLLQTEDYARLILRETVDPEEFKRAVRFRMARQALLFEPDAPAIIVILDEAVFCRSMGGPEVMRGQLDYLSEMAQRPNVTLQVLPFAAGPHPAVDGGFEIITFPDPLDPDVVYIEHATSDIYLEDTVAVGKYISIFDRVQGKALSPEASVLFIAQGKGSLERYCLRGV